MSKRNLLRTFILLSTSIVNTKLNATNILILPPPVTENKQAEEEQKTKEAQKTKWGHILLKPGYGFGFGDNKSHHYSLEFKKNNKLFLINEYTQDLDNTASTSILAQKTYEAQQKNSIPKSNFSFVSTYVDPDKMAAWAKKMLNNILLRNMSS